MLREIGESNKRGREGCKAGFLMLCLVNELVYAFLPWKVGYILTAWFSEIHFGKPHTIMLLINCM